MGVTIHCKGRLRALDDIARVEAIVQEHAKVWDLPTHPVEQSDASDLPFLPDAPFDPDGPIRGAIIQPHSDCEPVLLFLDRNGYTAFSCKTQFAPPRVHIEIIRFLDLIEPYFASFEVRDEGDSWESRDEATLLHRMEVIRNGLNMLAGLFEHGKPKAITPSGHGLN